MVGRLPWLACSALLALAARMAPGQAPALLERHAVAGRVVAHDGRPVPGAAVTLLARPFPAHPEIGPPDTVRATTCSEGRFQARIRGGLAYSAWAEVHTQGRLWFSEVADWVVPGVSPLLKMNAFPFPRIEVEPSGREAWSSLEPLAFQVAGGTVNRILRTLEQDLEGRLLLPPVPGRSAALLACSPAGRPLRSLCVPLDHGDRRLSLALPRPLSLELELVRSEDGGPLPGARVLIPFEGTFHSLGQTGPEGTLAALVPAEGFQAILPAGAFLWLWVQAPDRAGRIETCVPLDRISGPGPKEPPGPPIHRARKVLGRGRILTGRLPIAGPTGPVPLVLLCDHAQVEDQGAPLVFQTDAEGGFQIPLASQEGFLAFQLWALLSPELLARTAPPPGWFAPPLALLQSAALGPPEASEEERFPGARFEPLTRFKRPSWARIQVLRAHDVPADRPEVYLGEKHTLGGVLGPHPFLRADCRGRIALLAAAEERPGVLVKEGEFLEEAELLLARPEGWEPTRLLLKPALFVSGRVLDAAGEPLSGAWVDPGACVTMGLYRHPLVHLLPANQNRSGADGAFKLYYLPGEIAALSAGFYDPRGRLWSSAWEQIELRDRPVTDLILRLR